MNTTYKLVHYDPDESMSCPRLGRFAALHTYVITGELPRIGDTMYISMERVGRLLRVTHVEREIQVRDDNGDEGNPAEAGPIRVFAVRA